MKSLKQNVKLFHEKAFLNATTSYVLYWNVLQNDSCVFTLSKIALDMVWIKI